MEVDSAEFEESPRATDLPSRDQLIEDSEVEPEEVENRKQLIRASEAAEVEPEQVLETEPELGEGEVPESVADYANAVIKTELGQDHMDAMGDCEEISLDSVLQLLDVIEADINLCAVQVEEFLVIQRRSFDFRDVRFVFPG